MTKRRFNSLADCKRYLADILNRLEANELDAEGVRVRSYSTQILSKIVEAGDLENRVAALEEKLKAGGAK
jgi:hypothetical protein